MKPEGKEVARKADYEVCEIGRKGAASFIREHHYAKSSSVAARSWGLLRKHGGGLVGVAQFLPPLPPAARKVAEIASVRGLIVDPKRVVSLSRLAVAPGEPQNAASILVGSALRQLRKEGKWGAVVTFADTSQGHTGRVYLALNAEPVGFTQPEIYWVDPKSGARVSRKATRSRTVAEMRALGLERRISKGKHRFIWWLVRVTS